MLFMPETKFIVGASLPTIVQDSITQTYPQSDCCWSAICLKLASGSKRNPLHFIRSLRPVGTKRGQGIVSVVVLVAIFF